MAHTFQFSADATFSSSPLVWSVGVAEYIGWVDEIYGSPIAKLKVLEPLQHAGLTQKVLNGLPPEISIQVPHVTEGKFTRKLHKPIKRIRLEILVSERAPETHKIKEFDPLRKFDGWSMRTDFLRLKQDSAALADFLNLYGEWGNFTSPRFSFEGTERGILPTIVPPDWIWNVKDMREPRSQEDWTKPEKYLPLQDVIRWGLVCGESKWLSSRFYKCQLEGPKPSFPHFLVTERGCFDALFSTVTLDYLAGTKHRLCARHDCRMPFALESRHSRVYCTQYCAHLESVRRTRKAPKIKR